MDAHRLNLIDENDDYLHDPMAYDAMRELANRVAGRYVAWERESSGLDAKHWFDERIRVRLAVRAVDGDSRSSVAAMTAELRDTLQRMPEHAPSLA